MGHALLKTILLSTTLLAKSAIAAPADYAPDKDDLTKMLSVLYAAQMILPEEQPTFSAKSIDGVVRTWKMISSEKHVKKRSTSTIVSTFPLDITTDEKDGKLTCKLIFKEKKTGNEALVMLLKEVKKPDAMS